MSAPSQADLNEPLIVSADSLCILKLRPAATEDEALASGVERRGP